MLFNILYHLNTSKNPFLLSKDLSRVYPVYCPISVGIGSSPHMAPKGNVVIDNGLVKAHHLMIKPHGTTVKPRTDK